MSNEMIQDTSAAEALAAWQEPTARRAMAEVQAAIVIAKANPRNEDQAFQDVEKACKRPQFAGLAFYSYPRGGGDVSGMTIRVAELLGQCWGNLRWGHRVIAREGNISKVEVFAWDVQRNTYVTREIMVKHVRDTQGGQVPLRDERDVKELIDNQAQRTVRTLIFNVLPADYVALAGQTCEATLAKQDADVPLIDRARKAASIFQEEFGVSVTRILTYFHADKLDALTAKHLNSLRKIMVTLRNEDGKPEDFFPLEPKAGVVDPTAAQAKPAQAPRTMDDVVAQAKPAAPPKVSEPSLEEQEAIRQREIAEAAADSPETSVAAHEAAARAAAQPETPQQAAQRRVARDRAAVAADKAKEAAQKSTPKPPSGSMF